MVDVIIYSLTLALVTQWLLPMILNTKNMDCAFPKFKIFNLSLSNLSFLFSTSLLLFCLKKYNRNIFK